MSVSVSGRCVSEGCVDGGGGRAGGIGGINGYYQRLQSEYPFL